MAAVSGALDREIDSLRSQLAEAKRDAERYRWLRNDSVRAPHHTPTVFRHGGGSDIIDGPELDAAIDAALQNSGEPHDKERG